MHDIEATIKLFQQYTERLATGEQGKSHSGEDLAAEVIERLRQLNFILLELERLEGFARQIVTVEVVDSNGEHALFNPNIERDQFHFFLMRFLTESFYYFAFRIRQIVRHKTSPFPDLHQFDSQGVRDVRNHLIEHPEGNDSRVFSQIFSFSPDSGMHLKAGRKEAELGRHNDSGLKANAAEFVSKLDAAIANAIASFEV
jgi:hypothetical protein